MTTAKTDIDQLCINTIRTLSLDAIQKANSGHPGLPLGMAPAAYVLWTKFLRHNPKNPKWFGRDRFLLSAGHGSMLIYSLLHLTGYDLSLDDIKQFRQLHSKTPGHPENVLTPGVEITTGPLGQGFANGVGMGIAQAHLAAVDIHIDELLFAKRKSGLRNQPANIRQCFKFGEVFILAAGKQKVGHARGRKYRTARFCRVARVRFKHEQLIFHERNRPREFTKLEALEPDVEWRRF